MIHKKSILLLLFIFWVQVCARAQLAVIDSVKRLVTASTTKEHKLLAIHEVLKYRNSLPGDTILYYSGMARELAIAMKDKKQERIAFYYQLTGKLAKGSTDSLLFVMANEPLIKFNKNEDAGLYYKVQLLKASVLNRINERAKALDLQLKLLDEAEIENDIVAQAYVLNYTGATYYNLNQLKEARLFWMRGLQLTEQNRNEDLNEIEATIYSNLCLYYGALVNIQRTKNIEDSLLFYINKSVAYSKRHNVFWILASSLTMRGSYYGYKGKIELADTDFKEAISIRSKMGDPLYISNDLINMGQFYYSTKQYSKCIEVLQRVLDINAKNHIVESNNHTLTLLSAAYKTTGDYKSYSQTLERFIIAADSAGRINAAEKIAEIQTRYEVQKKEALIAKQQLDLFKQNVLLVSVTIILLLLLTVAYYTFTSYKKRQKLKMDAALLAEKKQGEEAVKEAQEAERKRIAAELHDNMGVHATAILHNTSLLQFTDNANSEVVNNLQKTAKEMLVNLRETLWVMKRTDIAAMDLWLRIISFSKQMGRNYNRVRITVEGEAPAEKVIPSAKALNIILLLQEAINNAVKHAAATSIIVSSSIQNGKWVINVTDNGKGFNVEQELAGKEKYGLKNMQQRAAEGGFSYYINTIEGDGTSVALAL
ncbi:MAG: histidine kinase [Flavihumibacter sp.]|nr:histidine kinase [Flavihumibacter sp.]